MTSHEYTPWQTWAQAYNAERNGHPFVDSEDADAYSHASWEACKARCLEILKRHVEPVDVDHFDDEYISLDALKEIEAL